MLPTRPYISNFLFFIFPFLASLLLAQEEMEMPIETQFNLFFKIIEFDRNFNAEQQSRIFAIVYQSKYRYSLNTKEYIFTDFVRRSKSQLEEMKISLIAIDLNETALIDFLANRKIDYMYIAPLRSFDIKEITEQSQRHKILTLTGMAEYVKLGLSVGISRQGNHPSIIINLPASKNEGVLFGSQLLKLAQIVD
jgi:hypothetical protein